MNRGMAVTAEIAVAQIVGKDHDQVRFEWFVSIVSLSNGMPRESAEGKRYQAESDHPQN